MFTLKPGTTKCFTVALSAGEEHEVYYKMAKSHAAFVNVYLHDARGITIFSHTVAESEHTHRFHCERPGDHGLCLKSKERATGSFEVTVELRDTSLLQFNMQRALEEAEIASGATSNKDNQGLVHQAQYIQSTIRTVQSEYTYLKEREIQLRDSIEETNSSAMWMTIWTVVIMIVVRMLYQYTLKRHLEKKRILS